jgi:hypothetical protein
MTEPDDDQGVLLNDVGPAWIPPCDPPAPAPKWLNGRAFPAVWRDTLPFTAGGLLAAKSQFPHLMPGSGWTANPQPDSDLDLYQAIAAKLHLGLRVLPILAEAQLVVIEPDDMEAIPEWDDEDELAKYAAEAQLPASPMFLDFEAADGEPVVWEEESWPLPFNLRGAITWVRDGMISVIPFGSLNGVHPWGGTDYQAWARWAFLQEEPEAWPRPGPGDFIARANGEVASWVDVEGESICAHQGSVTYNLAQRVLRLLWALELLEVPLVPPSLSRPERRRAKRGGQSIGLVPDGLPRWAQDAKPEEDDEWSSQMTEPCPVADTHARLNQAHALWHEALDAYNDPEGFVAKVNLLIQTLRNVTWVLQKELGPHPTLKEGWYADWQERMKADARLRWIITARNQIVKQGDLDTHSKVRVRIVGEMISGSAIDIEVEPAAPAHEIVRKIHVGALDPRVREEGTLVVERRWTVDQFPDDELLDVLAHCYAVLSRLVVEAHEQLGASTDTCEKTADDPCAAGGATEHPSGRQPCMWAGREARTSRRNLDSGAPTGVAIHTVARPPLDIKAIRRRYSKTSWPRVAPDADIFERASVLHENGRQMLLVDGRHIMIAWLFRDGEPRTQQTLWPEDARDKYLMMEQLAVEATRLGANELILTAEAWEAPYIGGDDPRDHTRAGNREDRSEALVTHALRRGGGSRTWRSVMTRTDAGLQLEDAETQDGYVPPLLQPLMDGWAEWSPSS